MLQLHEENRAAMATQTLAGLLAVPPESGSALELHANGVIDALRTERARVARRGSLAARLGSRIDESMRTDAVEHMDEATYPEKGKLAIAQGLHLLNWVTGSYRNFFALLEPMIRQVVAEHGRPARILEVACGAGGFSMELSTLASRKGLDVEVTGSDIVPLYVERATRKAEKEGNAARFRRIDALDMSDVAEGAYDIVFVAQSVHHFSPGQLARMISETSRIATTAFVSVDGYRSIPMVGFVAGTALLTLWPAMVHDAVISVRKFYGERELEVIATLGAPRANVDIGRIWPLNTTLTVRFDQARA
jgi:2-polyprenyl-3-methyl-5-hydroxy-6-metoxy-1,4-benzoquinol methylase